MSGVSQVTLISTSKPLVSPRVAVAITGGSPSSFFLPTLLVLTLLLPSATFFYLTFLLLLHFCQNVNISDTQHKVCHDSFTGEALCDCKSCPQIHHKSLQPFLSKLSVYAITDLPVNQVPVRAVKFKCTQAIPVSMRVYNNAFRGLGLLTSVSAASWYPGVTGLRGQFTPPATQAFRGSTCSLAPDRGDAGKFY